MPSRWDIQSVPFGAKYHQFTRVYTVSQRSAKSVPKKVSVALETTQ